MTSSRRRVPTSVVVSLVLLGGCGGDGGDPPDPSTTTTTLPDAEGRAGAVNVSLDDLPPEFVAARQEEERADGSLAACLERFAADAEARVESPVFQRAAGSGRIFLTSITVVMPSEESATELSSAFRQPAVVTCLDDAVSGALVDTSQGAAIVNRSLAEVGDAATYGEESAQLSGMVTFTVPGVEQPVELTYTLVMVRTDEIVTVLLSGGLVEPFPDPLRVELTELVASRQA